MHWRLGTMGWTDPDWVDGFYPRGLEGSQRLGFYARHFNTVEIDSTFYAMPSAGRLRHWADAVPANFRFTLKTPRLITHDLPLSQAVEPMRAFAKVVREMGPKLGVVLIQFPPRFGVENRRGLERLLDVLPEDIRFAVEFRHPSWWTDATHEMLRRRGLIWTAGDYDEQPLAMHVTSDQLYVRWIGTHERFASHVHEQQDRSERLAWWRARIERAAAELQTVWGLFNNDFAGSSIETCNRFKAMLGLAVKPTLGAQQGRFEW